jgi:hypothetical protein
VRARYRLPSTTYLDWLSTQNDKVLGTRGQETHKLLAKNFLDVVGLLDLDADAHRVD